MAVPALQMPRPPAGVRLAARDAGMYLAGLVFLALAKAKHVLQGYTSPKTFSLAETERCIDYDLKVVDEWLVHLAAYCGAEGTLDGKTVLELGPGSDLGVGLYLLAKGAAIYNACDVHDLIHRAPPAFYSALVDRIAAVSGDVDRTSLLSQIEGSRRGGSRLRAVIRSDFDLIAAFGASSIDLVFSQAAFEHFDDVSRTIEQLSVVCKKGAVIVAEIDLKTHSRWIRDKDPNNIYRYPEGIYRAFRFRGIPNRMRPHEYRRLFELHGWTNVSITPLERRTAGQSVTGMDRQFADPINQLDVLSLVLCARKA